MKAVYCTLFFLLCASLAIYAQPKHAFSFKAGYTYNTPIEMLDQPVEDSRGFFFTLGGVKKMFSYKENSFETGLIAKTIFASGKFNGTEFNASTLRLAIPARIVFPISNKIELVTGVLLQNNVDINNFDFKLRDKYSWRLDFLGEINWSINDDWFVIASGNFNLRDMPDSFFTHDPKIAFSIGFGKRVFIETVKRDVRRAKRKQKRKNKKQ